jgi:rubrerythrin
VAAKKASDRKSQMMSDVLRFAIQQEEEAAQAYGAWSEKASRPSLRELYLELRAEEINHRRLLEEIMEGKSLALSGSEVQDLKISDYLVEEPLDAESGFQDILIFAAKKEAKAVELYAQLLNKSTSAEHKRLFEFLIQQEKKHKFKLEQEYEEQILQED